MVAAWWMMWKLTAEFILDGNYSSVRRTGGGPKTLDRVIRKASVFLWVFTENQISPSEPTGYLKTFY